MYPGKGPHIFDLSKLAFEDIRRSLHNRAYIRAESHDTLVNMNTLQILDQKYDIGC